MILRLVVIVALLAIAFWGLYKLARTMTVNDYKTLATSILFLAVSSGAVFIFVNLF